MDFYEPYEDFPDKPMPRAVCQKNLDFLCLISHITKILDNTQQIQSRNFSYNLRSKYTHSPIFKMLRIPVKGILNTFLIAGGTTTEALFLDMYLLLILKHLCLE